MSISVSQRSKHSDVPHSKSGDLRRGSRCVVKVGIKLTADNKNSNKNNPYAIYQPPPGIPIGHPPRQSQSFASVDIGRNSINNYVYMAE